MAGPSSAVSSGLEDASDASETGSQGDGVCIVEEVQIAEPTEPFLLNSVLLVPDLLSQDECDLLISSVEEHLTAGGLWLSQHVAYKDPLQAEDGGALKRVRLRDLSEEAQALAATLLRERTLILLEQRLPWIAVELFGRSSYLDELQCCFAEDEPAVNRYTTGGQFLPHRDRYSITVYVTLSQEVAYSGGGTGFWPQDLESERAAQPAVVVRPAQGTGVIFNGHVLHAGLPVESGVRHLFVSSFHLEDPDRLPPPRQWRGGRKGDIVERATE